MIEQLIYWDKALFLFFNSKHNAFFDVVMFWMSNKFVWIPLYLFFIYLTIRYFKRNAIWVILCIFLVVGLSDFISVHLFKNLVMRLRPCHEPSLLDLVHIVNGKCGGQYGFYSSHASNHFALATIFTLFFKSKINQYWIILLFLWAGIIAYSRIYLGVHYPGDVLTGAIAGSVVAAIFFRLFNLIWPKVV